MHAASRRACDFPRHAASRHASPPGKRANSAWAGSKGPPPASASSGTQSRAPPPSSRSPRAPPSSSGPPRSQSGWQAEAGRRRMGTGWSGSWQRDKLLPRACTAGLKALLQPPAGCEKAATSGPHLKSTPGNWRCVSSSGCRLSHWEGPAAGAAAAGGGQQASTQPQLQSLHLLQGAAADNAQSRACTPSVHSPQSKQPRT